MENTSTIQNNIIVNFTTWKKRDWCVPNMIREFKKQTLKPRTTFCWLSKEEYNENNLPTHLQKCVNDGDFEIKWVDKNTYCHKRHEVFKEYNDCYNIFIDDDNMYPPTLVEELYKASVDNPNTVISYIGYTQDYVGTKRIMNPYNKSLGNSFKHTFLGNGVIIPPNTFPLESFKYCDVRDKMCPKCDESWLVPWLIKKGIKFNVLHDRSKMEFKSFTNTQGNDEALYKEMFKTNNGVREKEKYLTNVIKFLKMEKQYKEIFPNFNINACYDKKIIAEIMGPKENANIIVTVTSWKKRINNLPTVFESILKQTKLPNKIVLNLSSEEFPNKENDIPSSIIDFIKKHNIIEIYWVDGPNTRQWKKIIPTILRYPNDWIICIDDDRIYWPQFIETLWNKHLQYPNNAITLNRSYKVNGYCQHCGHGTLECAYFYDNFDGIDFEEIRKNTESSDTTFNYLLNRSGHGLISIDGSDGSRLFNEIEPLRTTRKTGDHNAHIKIWTWLENKYGKITEVPTINNNTDNTVKKKVDTRTAVLRPVHVLRTSTHGAKIVRRSNISGIKKSR